MKKFNFAVAFMISALVFTEVDSRDNVLIYKGTMVQFKPYGDGKHIILLQKNGNPMRYNGRDLKVRAPKGQDLILAPDEKDIVGECIASCYGLKKKKTAKKPALASNNDRADEAYGDREDTGSDWEQ